MELLELTLRNFRQHTEKRVEFRPGLNAILGPIGSGKTTLVHAAYGAFTNDFRGEGKKAEDISQYAGPDEASSAELKFSHRGTVGTIRRDLRTASNVRGVASTRTGHYLQLGEEKPIRRDNEISKRLYEFLGVDEHILSDFCFVDQWEVFSFLRARPAARAHLCQRLFGLEQAEQAWAAVGAEMSSRQASLPLQVDLTPVRNTINRLQRELDQVRQEGQLIGDPDSQRLANLRRLCAQYHKQCIAKAGRVEWEKRADAANSALLERTRQADALKADVEVLVAALPALAQQAKNAAEAISAHNRYDSAAVRRASLEKEKAELLSSPAKEPDRPSGYAAPDDKVWKSLEAKSTRRHILQGYLTQVGTGKEACPACGTPGSHLKDRIKDYKEELGKLLEDLSKLEARKKASAVYDSDVSEYKRCEWLRASRLQTIDELLQQQCERPTMTRADAQLLIGQHLQASQAAQEAEAELQTARTMADHLRQELNTATAEIKRLNSELKGEITEAADALNRQEIREMETSLDRRRQIDNSVRFLEAELYQQRAALADGEATKAKCLVAQSWLARLDPVRQILHRDALPRIVAKHHLAKVDKVTNEFLSAFDSSFTVSVQDDLSFGVQFADGRKHGEGRLSGGQMVVLALAMRMAISQLFASEIGFMCLDEPTAGLGQGSLKCFETALSQLQAHCHNTGLQVILVTHEMSLEHMFDHIIRLEAT